METKEALQRCLDIGVATDAVTYIYTALKQKYLLEAVAKACEEYAEVTGGSRFKFEVTCCGYTDIIFVHSLHIPQSFGTYPTVQAQSIHTTSKRPSWQDAWCVVLKNAKVSTLPRVNVADRYSVSSHSLRKHLFTDQHLHALILNTNLNQHAFFLQIDCSRVCQKKDWVIMSTPRTHTHTQKYIETITHLHPHIQLNCMPVCSFAWRCQL